METFNFTLSGYSVIELNEMEVTRLTPLLLFLSTVGFFGIPGNCFVIYAFRKSCQGSNSHLFFLWLAIIDLFNCALVLPFEFVNVANQYTYDYEWLCKITIFFTYVLTLTSGFTLTIISIDRFRKVCRLTKWQFSNKTTRILCVASFIIALLASWPVLFLYGIHHFEIPEYIVTAGDCSVSNKYEHSEYVKIFNGFLWIVFVAAFSIMMFLYIIIGREIFKQTRKMKRHTQRHRDVLGAQTHKFKTSSNGTKSNSGTVASGQNNDTEYDELDRALSMPVERQFSTVYDEAIDKKIAESQKKARRSAMIMFFISLAFMISYSPYLILRLWEAVSVHFISSMTDTERAIYKTFLRSYWLNCVINPFIYCACAPQFRKEGKNLWKKAKACK